MALFESVLKSMGFGDEITPYSYRATLLGEDKAVIEGVKKILLCTDKEIIFSVKSGKLRIFGENLIIKKFAYGEVAVKGQISGVTHE